MTITVPDDPATPETEAQPDRVDDEVCKYAFGAKVKVSLSLMGLETSATDVEVEGATTTIHFKHGGTSDATKMDLDWTGTKTKTIKNGKIEITLKKLDFSGEKNASDGFEFSGTADVHFEVKEDITLVTTGVILRKNSKGDLTLTYAKSGAVSSKFSGLDVTVDLVKPQTSGTPKVLATFKAGSSQSVANAIEGKFSASQTDDIEIGNIKFKLDSFLCDGVLHIDTAKMDIKEGDIKATITFPENKKSSNYVTGSAQIKGKYKQGVGYTGNIDIEETAPMHFAGGNLYGNIEGKFDDGLALIHVKSSAFYLKHEDFGSQEIKVSNFNYTSSGLEQFVIDKAKIVYLGKAVVMLENASWAKDEGVLEIEEAFVEFGNDKVKLQTEGFQIDAKVPSISIDRFFGSADFSPMVSATFDGVLTAQAFEADINVTVAKVEAFGSVGMGMATESSGENFNWAHLGFSIDLGSNGVIIPDTPFKLTALGARAGYNESYEGNNNWEKERGTYAFGGILGICDTAGLVNLNGDVNVNLNGNGSDLKIKGRVTVPVSSPYYVEGNTEANVYLGSGDMEGTLQATLRYPKGSGTMLRLDTGEVCYWLTEDKIEIFNRSNLSGTILNWLTFYGTAGISAPRDNLNAMSGHGYLQFNHSDQVHYNYSAVGISFDVDFLYHLEGEAYVALADADCWFDVHGSFGAIAEGTFNWPALFGGGTTDVHARVDCPNAGIKKLKNQPTVYVSGEMYFTFNGVTKSVTINNMPLK